MEIDYYRDQFLKNWLTADNISEIYCVENLNCEYEFIGTEIWITSVNNSCLYLKLNKEDNIKNNFCEFSINHTFIFSYECDVIIYDIIYNLIKELPKEKVIIDYWD